MDENLRRPWDLVVFHARKDGNSEGGQMTRSTAEARKAELEAEGWTCEIQELNLDAVDDERTG